MYQSPIEFITIQLNTQIEDGIYKAVQKYGVKVDKDELIKALQYDRGQYQKGYNDRDSEIVRCKDCPKWIGAGAERKCILLMVYTPGDWFCADGEKE